tara:strand:- start:11 stop:223 length:213 start_codon:yes stop_codon:yes gene_type:complete
MADHMGRVGICSVGDRTITTKCLFLDIFPISYNNGGLGSAKAMGLAHNGKTITTTKNLIALFCIVVNVEG